MFEDPNAVFSSEFGERQVIGVIQMINKVAYDGQLEYFEDQDIEVMELFAKFVGPKLSGSSMMKKDAHAAKEGSFDEAHMALGELDEGDLHSHHSPSAAARKRASQMNMGSFQEDEVAEEEAEDDG